jgi:hypothetical protein
VFRLLKLKDKRENETKLMMDLHADLVEKEMK